MTHEDAIKMLRAAGYRVTRPAIRKVSKDQPLPVFVARFDKSIWTPAQTTRMTTFTTLTKLDQARGERLSRAAYRLRTGHQAPAMAEGYFELDGVRLAA